MTDRYKVQRNALQAHAAHVQQEGPTWKSVGESIKGAEVEAIAFTKAGALIADTYSKIVHDFAWTAWRIGETLDGCALVLQGTASNYGKAEAIISDSLTNRREWQM